MKNLIDKRYPVTNALLLLTGIVFILMQLIRFGEATTAATIFEFGGMYGEMVRLDVWQLWRLFSPIFVHIGWEHFMFNALTLFGLGSQVEQIFGSRRFLVLYILSGLMGNVFVMVFTPHVVGAGASTSLFGVFAAVVILKKISTNHYLQILGQRYTIFLAMNLFFSVLSPSISLAGHLGGAIGGALAVLFLAPMVEEDTWGTATRLAGLVGYGILLGGLVVWFYIS